MKKRNKKYSQDKSISSFLVGSFYEFDVLDPLGEMPEITNTDYGHNNAIKAVMMKSNLKYLHQVFDVKRLKWKSVIDMQFHDGVKPYSRIAEIVWFGLLKQCEGEYQQTIEEIFSVSNMSHYRITHVTAEVIGMDQIKDSDFSISKSEAA